DADRLSLTSVDVGDGQVRHIICGAANVAAGQTVWVALPGTEIHLPAGRSYVIQVSRIRGHQSAGMSCAEGELGLGDNHDGSLVLPDTIAIGTAAAEYCHVVTDTVYEIGRTPNRSDATSVLGVADALAAFLSVQQAVYHRVQWPDIPEIGRAHV